jgi:signal transduction histidine kinase
VFSSASAPDLHLPDEAMVRGDEDLLRVAAVNLLDNARKFGAAGGRSTVEVGVLGGRIHLKVTTSGARIDGPAKARLFDRFYRSPEARAETLGHGLGLSLARHIALMHGGDLTLASGDDEDAMFLLELPAWQPE